MEILLTTEKTINSKKNYFHKPQFSLRDFWAVNDKLYISNIAYASIGNGGGTNLSGNNNNLDINGQDNFQEAYDFNSNNINPLYNLTERARHLFTKFYINNHYWYGALSTLNYELNDAFNFSGVLILDTTGGNITEKCMTY